VTADGRFADRADAGRQLGTRLADRPRPGALVLGLPRGGVLVAAEVARALGAPLDVLVVAKLRLPGRPELAMGAVSAVAGAVGAVRVEEVVADAGVPEDVLAHARDEAVAGLHRRAAVLRGDRPEPLLAGRPVVVVYDGRATGATVRAAVAAARAHAPSTLTVAVPVGAPGALVAVRQEVDELVCLRQPAAFRFVAQFYDDFRQTSDAEVRAALAAGDPPHGRPGAGRA
jgi:predicted phosphoribosyltransferase